MLRVKPVRNINKRKSWIIPEEENEAEEEATSNGNPFEGMIGERIIQIYHFNN